MSFCIIVQDYGAQSLLAVGLLPNALNMALKVTDHRLDIQTFTCI